MGSHDEDNALVYFFIFSQLGKYVNKFFPSKVLRDHNFEDTIVFIAGTEFLVCKREQVYDNLLGVMTHHIYLREVQIGLGETNFLICDDKIYATWGHNNFDYIRRQQYEMYGQNIKFILKNNSQIALAYFRSEFFRISLAICKTFRVMQNKTREHDDKVLFNSMDRLNFRWYAGLRFLENLYQETADLYPDTHKMKMMIFSGKNKATIETFDEYMRAEKTFDLSQIKTWMKNQPIVLTDKVDAKYEEFFGSSKK